MNRLEQHFGEQVTFVYLNYDDPTAFDRAIVYGLMGRSQYALVDESGDVVRRWIGPLDEAQITAAFVEFLSAP